MSLTFDEPTHTYRWDGKPVPSVTQILDSAGIYSFGNVPYEILQYRREVGSAVHKATELNDLGTLDPLSVNDLILAYLEAWRRFLDESKFQIEGIEQRIYHPNHKYAGTLDRSGRFPPPRKSAGPTLAILDIKTGQPQRATGPQTAAYAHAEQVTRPGGGHFVRRRFAVYLQDDGRYELVPHEDHGDFAVFLAALTLHRWRTR